MKTILSIAVLLLLFGFIKCCNRTFSVLTLADQTSIGIKSVDATFCNDNYSARRSEILFIMRIKVECEGAIKLLIKMNNEVEKNIACCYFTSGSDYDEGLVITDQFLENYATHNP